MQTMKKRSARWIVAVVAAMTTLMLAPTAASADSGVDRNRIRFESQGQVDEFLSSVCGVPVVVDSTFNIHILEFSDGRSKVHVNFRSTYSSPDGGLSRIGKSMIQFEPSQMIDNGDGTITMLVPHRETVSSVYLIDGANVTDAGVIDWELRFVVDATTGELLNEEEVIVQTVGHFPVISLDGGPLQLVCDSLTP